MDINTAFIPSTPERWIMTGNTPGESVKILNEHLTKAGFELIHSDGLKTLWQPGDVETAQALEYGKEIAGKI